MRRILCIWAVLSAAGTLLDAQVIDTSKQINTWKLEHNFTRFGEAPLDTNLHQVHRDYHPVFDQGFSYETLGILGQSVNHVDFFRRPDPGSFVFGQGMEPYLKTPGRTLFFNTRTPFTSVAYSTLPVVDWREENIEAMHTQNLTPFANFGIYFNILAGKELYLNEETRSNRIGLFGSRAKNRYSIFGTFYYNDFRAQEHGGLQDLQSFLDGTSGQPWENVMRLSEANSRYRNLSLFATQKYNLLERVTTTDTLGNTTSTGRNLSLSHQFRFDRHVRTYEDAVSPSALSSFYDNYYYEVTNPKDSASEDRLSNVFQVILGDPDFDPVSARVYAGYELRRFGVRSPEAEQVFSQVDTLPGNPPVLDSVFRDSAVARFRDTWYNDVYLGFHMAGPTQGRWDWVVDGRYYLAGYYRNNFRVNATFSRELGEVSELGLRGSFSLLRPHPFTNSYSSAFFRWENDYPSALRITGEAFILGGSGLDLRARVAYLNNYLYWDTRALPQVYDRDILVLSGYFTRHFIVSGYNSENKLLLQYSTAPGILNLPLASFYSSNYWRQPLFKGALVTTVGFDLYMTTPYRASAYMPATGVFHLQDEGEVGGYPFLDVFLALRIARTRIFVSYNNLLHGIRFIGNRYFTTYRYPMKPRHFRVGLVWTFYD